MNRVLVVPSCGHTDERGMFTRGHCIDAISEYDIISKVIPAIEDSFESRAVRYAVVPGIRSPGVKPSEHNLFSDPTDLVVSIGVGYTKESLGHNFTQIFHNGDRLSQILAQEMSDILADWGSCAVFGHKSKLPRKYDKEGVISYPGTRLHLEPFVLNGYEGLEYCRFLDRLGDDIGAAIADFLKRRKSGAITEKYRLMSFVEPDADLTAFSLILFDLG